MESRRTVGRWWQIVSPVRDAGGLTQAEANEVGW